MNKTFKLFVSLTLLGAFHNMEARAQHGDTVYTKLTDTPPSSVTTTPELNGILLQSPVTGQTQVLLLPDIKVSRRIFYQDLEWPPKQKGSDPKKPYLYMGLEKQLSLKEQIKEKPVYGVYLVAACIAGMLNHQIQGVNKEMELNIKINTYTRTNVPASARDPFLVPAEVNR